MIMFNGESLEVHNFGEKIFWLEKWKVMRYNIEHGLRTIPIQHLNDC